MGLIAGTKLGPCEIVGPLGAGGMGEVYRAKDTRPRRFEQAVINKVLAVIKRIRCYSLLRGNAAIRILAVTRV